MPFVLPWTVRASGTSAAEDVLLEVELPDGAGLSIDIDQRRPGQLLGRRA